MLSSHYTKGDSHLIVSNGVGNWFPLRTRAPAEIIHLTLRRAWVDRALRARCLI